MTGETDGAELSASGPHASLPSHDLLFCEPVVSRCRHDPAVRRTADCPQIVEALCRQHAAAGHAGSACDTLHETVRQLGDVATTHGAAQSWSSTARSDGCCSERHASSACGAGTTSRRMPTPAQRTAVSHRRSTRLRERGIDAMDSGPETMPDVHIAVPPTRRGSEDVWITRRCRSAFHWQRRPRRNLSECWRVSLADCLQGGRAVQPERSRPSRRSTRPSVRDSSTRQ